MIVRTDKIKKNGKHDNFIFHHFYFFIISLLVGTNQKKKMSSTELTLDSELRCCITNAITCGDMVYIANIATTSTIEQRRDMERALRCQHSTNVLHLALWSSPMKPDTTRLALFQRVCTTFECNTTNVLADAISGNHTAIVRWILDVRHVTLDMLAHEAETRAIDRALDLYPTMADILARAFGGYAIIHRWYQSQQGNKAWYTLRRRAKLNYHWTPESRDSVTSVDELADVICEHDIHLVRYIVDTIDATQLHAMKAGREKRGDASYIQLAAESGCLDMVQLIYDALLYSATSLLTRVSEKHELSSALNIAISKGYQSIVNSMIRNARISSQMLPVETLQLLHDILVCNPDMFDAIVCNLDAHALSECYQAWSHAPWYRAVVADELKGDRRVPFNPSF